MKVVTDDACELLGAHLDFRRVSTYLLDGQLSTTSSKSRLQLFEAAFHANQSVFWTANCHDNYSYFDEY